MDGLSRLFIYVYEINTKAVSLYFWCAQLTIEDEQEMNQLVPNHQSP